MNKIITISAIAALLLGINVNAYAKENMQKLLEIYIYSLLIELDGDQALKEQIKNLKVLKGYAIYPVKRSGNKDFLRIGFFSSKKSSLKVLNKLPVEISNHAKVQIIPNKEVSRLEGWLKSKNTSNKEKSAPLNRKKLELLMEQARLAMLNRNYRVAIAYYTKVSNSEFEDFKQSAIEYLGLVRERNQQYAQAKAEYQRYLRLYPEGEGAERVKQRLDGLVFANLEKRKPLKKVKTKKSQKSWIAYGGIAQYYRRDVNVSGVQGDKILSSNGFSSFYYNTRLNKPGFSVNNRVSISHNADFNNSENNKFRVSTLYSKLENRQYKLSAAIGRQSQYSSGAYGRFDGATLGYAYNSKTTTRLVAGYPMDYSNPDKINFDSRFYSLNIETESFQNLFDVNSYFINQYQGGLIDRQAIGFDLRRFDSAYTFYSAFDYDFHFSVINNAAVNVNYKYDVRNEIGFNGIYRRSPILLSANALRGQSANDLNALQEIKTEEEIRQLALDRTARYAAVTASWKRKIRKNLKLASDYTLSRLSGTQSSDGVAATPDTGFEHHLAGQIITTDSLYQNDVTIAYLRYSKLSTSDRYSLSFIRRDPLRNRHQIRSYFRLSHQIRTDQSKVTTLQPSIKYDYKYSKRFRLEFETGLSHQIRENSFDEGNQSDIFFSLGYFSQF